MTSPEKDVEALRELAFDQACRALDHQVSALEGLRSRGGQLVAGATAATAFFGGTVLKDGSTASWWQVSIPVALYVGVALTVLLAILPARGWTSTLNAHTILKDYTGKYTLSDSHKYMAEDLQDAWQAQEKSLKYMGRWFTVATVMTIAAVVSWAWLLVAMT